MNREKIKARRERILGLLAKGLTETDIAQVLQSSQPTVSRDIKELKEQSKDFVNDVAKYFGYYYQESIQGIQQVIDRMKKDELAVLLNQIRAIGTPAGSECRGG